MNNTILIRWVSKINPNEEIARTEVPLDKKGRINLKKLCDDWFIKNPYWTEGETALTYDRDGKSHLAFNFCPELIITADQIGRNNLNTVSKVLYGKKEKVYVKSQPEAKMNLPTDKSSKLVYKSVEETVKKDTQPAPKIYKYVPVVAHTQKSSTQKTSTTKPTQTPPKKEEPKQEYSLEDLEKLAELRDAGILTEEEFNEKKKKILGF